MKTRLYIGMLLILFVVPAAVLAQDEGFMYGRITTIDGQKYEGPIRWGKEEIYWTDLFNAAKHRNENLRYLSDRDRDYLDERSYSSNEWTDAGSSRFTNWFSTRDYDRHNFPRDKNYVHQFACQFGEIKSIRPDGSKYATVEMQSGKKYEIDGEGYNDVGEEVKIIDKELGEIVLRWGRIDLVEFMSTHSRISQRFGDPLYGTVEAYGHKFTGYIQWDKDERVSTDRLDGSADDGKLSLEFGKIKSIERRGNHSLVILKSGRELSMDGSNDVSSGHRGVVIMSADFPSILVPWDEFDKVVFEEKTPAPMANYNQFKSQKELKGTLTTREGKSLSGKIIFDLDEEHDFELLQGKVGEFEYTAPFRNVKRLRTKNEERCVVEYRNGKQVTLDEAQDVNERNHGVLVFANDNSEPTYVRWEDVLEIEFQ